MGTKAKQILTDVAAFDGNLSDADTTVQKALETIDDLAVGGGSGLTPGDGGELTIDINGIIVPTHNFHDVDTYDGDGSDDLKTITATNADDGDRLTLRINNDGRNVVIQETGNIDIMDGVGSTYTLDVTTTLAVFQYSAEATKWYLIDIMKVGDPRASRAIAYVASLSWTGNDANNREIAVIDDRFGDEFTPDLVLIFTTEAKSYDSGHLDMGWYEFGAYGVMSTSSSAAAIRGRINGSADDFYQGINGANLLLGAGGTGDDWTNEDGWDYKAVAIKFGG